MRRNSACLGKAVLKLLAKGNTARCFPKRATLPAARASTPCTRQPPNFRTLAGTPIPHVPPLRLSARSDCLLHLALTLPLQASGPAKNATSSAVLRVLLLRRCAATAALTSATCSLASATPSRMSGTESTRSAWFVKPPHLLMASLYIFRSVAAAAHFQHSVRSMSMKASRRPSPKRTRCSTAHLNSSRPC
jgi:hypothetical protein